MIACKCKRKTYDVCKCRSKNEWLVVACRVITCWYGGCPGRPSVDSGIPEEQPKAVVGAWLCSTQLERLKEFGRKERYIRRRHSLQQQTEKQLFRNKL